MMEYFKLFTLLTGKNARDCMGASMPCSARAPHSAHKGRTMGGIASTSSSGSQLNGSAALPSEYKQSQSAAGVAVPHQNIHF